MRKYFLFIFLIGFSILSAQSGINPVAEFYKGTGQYPAWTNNIKWGNTINMATYATGANNFEKFENARDQLYLQGGGVLYYPAGTYDFSDIPGDVPSGRGLMLKKGVVILGETPVTNKLAADDGTLTLPTKFKFSYVKKNVTVNGVASTGDIPRMWNLVGITTGAANEQLKDVDNVGICWVNLDGATIYFGAQFNWGGTWSTAGSWLSPQVKTSWTSRKPDGTHYLDPFTGQIPNSNYVGAGKGRIVFGCQLDNSTPSNDVIDIGFGASGFHTYRFSGRISVYGSNVFIANNAVTKPVKCFRYDQKVNYRTNATPYNFAPKQDIEPILFDYAKALGIDVNKSLIGFSPVNRKDLLKSAYYEDDIVIIDNWVYSHGNKGYEVAGEWVVMRRNKNVRDFLQDGDNVYNVGTPWRLTMDGYQVSYEIDDNMARAIDLGGKSLWIDSCYYNNTGSNPGNDGEGILCQRLNDIEIFSWAFTHNTQGPGGDDSYIGGWNVYNIGHLNFKNTVRGFVGEAKTDIDTMTACAFVDNITGSIAVQGYPKEPVITVCPTSVPAPPSNIIVVTDDINKRVKITWKDNATNEIGYRIDRRSVGTTSWTKIAYRPLQGNVTTNDLGYPNLGNPNLPLWYDYLAPQGVGLEYRVVAINCDDNDLGASTTVSTSPLTTSIEEILSKIFFSLYPNPSNQSAFMNYQLIENSNVKIVMIDLLGQETIEIVNEKQIAGEHIINLDISGFPNGIYFMRMSVNDRQSIQKLIINK